MSFTEDAKQKFEAALEHLSQEISTLRTGRATPAFVEDILIEAYGQKQPVKALASISASDPQTIVVQPWDKGVLQFIEKGLRDSDRNFNPVNEGTIIRIPMPALTEERRKEIVKVLHQKLEMVRIQIRNIRDDVKSKIVNAEKSKEISEDERYAEQEKLDKVVKEYNEQIKKIGDEKEEDIMKI